MTETSYGQSRYRGGTRPTAVRPAGYHPGTVIQGFRITGGSTISEGGGVFIALASPTINNCEIRNNHATSHGGGLYDIG